MSVRRQSKKSVISTPLFKPDNGVIVKINNPIIKKEDNEILTFNKTNNTQSSKKSNKIMEKLNLTLNTTNFKNFVIDTMKVKFDINLEEGKKNKFSPGTSFVSLCVLSEFIVDTLINSVIGDNETDFNGLTEIKFMKLENKIYKTKNLKQNFIKYLLEFDNEKNYMMNSFINYKIINAYIQSKYSKSLKLDVETMNFICFLLNELLNKILNITFNFLIFTKKTIIKPNIINFIVSNIFTKDLYAQIETKLNDVLELKTEISESKTTSRIENDDEDKKSSTSQIDETEDMQILD